MKMALHTTLPTPSAKIQCQKYLHGYWPSFEGWFWEFLQQDGCYNDISPGNSDICQNNICPVFGYGILYHNIFLPKIFPDPNSILHQKSF